LYDGSGGRGVSPDKWFPPLPGKRCGYAGGLGLDNIKDELIDIKRVADNAPVWIDMESSLRDRNDNFDPFVCMKILEDVSKYIKP
jgi:hypothetical protein